MNDGLSVVIVNYFSEKYIEQLIESIIKNLNIKNFEIIIINNSTPSFTWSDSFIEKNNIKIIDSKGNIGFGRAVNMGAHLAKYKYLCIINPDVIVKDGTFLNKLYEFFETQSKDIGAISCLIKNEDGTLQRNFYFNKSLEKIPFIKNILTSLFFSKRISKNENQQNFNKPIEVGGFYGGFVIFKKDYFLKIKGFDPDFFMYAEDIELFRVRFNKQYKSILYPYVEIIHLGSKTDKYNLMKYQAQVSYLLYLRKEGNFFLFTYVTIFMLRYLLVLLLSKKDSSKKEAKGFFKSLKYLKTILKYPRGYGVLPNCLKIDEIPD